MRALGRWALTGLSIGFVFLSYVYLTLPDVRGLAEHNPETTAFIELRRAEAAAAGRRFDVRQRWVPYGRISRHLKRAVLVAEDDAFFEHEGVDVKQIRASLERGWQQGEVRGASTITQQLAKNLYLSPSRNPVRKLKELLIARRLEAALGKERILEIYLNVIEWGDGVFGCEAASRLYFGKAAAVLGPAEAALLAGAIINPRVHSPAKPSRRLLRRQSLILRRMHVRMAEPEPVTSGGTTPGAAGTPLADVSQPDQSPSEVLPSAVLPSDGIPSGVLPSAVLPADVGPAGVPDPAQTVQPPRGSGAAPVVLPPSGNSSAANGAHLPPALP